MSPAVGLRRRLLLYLRSRVPTALGRQSHLSSTVQCHRGVREAGSGPAGALPASPRGASEYIRNEGGYVIMSDGKAISVSRRKKDDFLRSLEKWEING